jgi:hypothetical protein
MLLLSGRFRSKGKCILHVDFAKCQLIIIQWKRELLHLFLLLVRFIKVEKMCYEWYIWISSFSCHKHLPFNPFLQWHHTLGISPQTMPFSHVQNTLTMFGRMCPSNDNPKRSNTNTFLVLLSSYIWRDAHTIITK